ncbi:MAG: hypothetical protein RIN55_05050 [Tissierellaceae bacterium]|nr:hypothetical protein [Tissierellaceae bacterium]
MELNFTVSLDENEQNLLKQIFDCNNDALIAKLEKISKASTIEYLKMILGQKVFTRGQDIKEYRLYLLIRYLFNGIIPDEQVITTLFQTTNSESRSLLKSVLAKYQYELKESINDTINLILQNDIQHDEEKDIYYVSNIALNIVDEMNKTLSSIDGSLNQINKRRSSLQTFDITPSAYEALCAYCGISQEGE